MSQERAADLVTYPWLDILLHGGCLVSVTLSLRDALYSGVYSTFSSQTRNSRCYSTQQVHQTFIDMRWHKVKSEGHTSQILNRKVKEIERRYFRTSSCPCSWPVFIRQYITSDSIHLSTNISALFGSLRLQVGEYKHVAFGNIFFQR